MGHKISNYFKAHCIEAVKAAGMDVDKLTKWIDLIWEHPTNAEIITDLNNLK